MSSIILIGFTKNEANNCRNNTITYLTVLLTKSRCQCAILKMNLKNSFPLGTVHVILRVIHPVVLLVFYHVAGIMHGKLISIPYKNDFFSI